MAFTRSYFINILEIFIFIKDLLETFKYIHTYIQMNNTSVHTQTQIHVHLEILMHSLFSSQNAEDENEYEFVSDKFLNYAMTCKKAFIIANNKSNTI